MCCAEKTGYFERTSGEGEKVSAYLALGDVEAEMAREGEVAVVGVRLDAAPRRHTSEESLQTWHLPLMDDLVEI